MVKSIYFTCSDDLKRRIDVYSAENGLTVKELIISSVMKEMDKNTGGVRK